MKHCSALVFAALALVTFSAAAAPKWNEEFEPVQKQALAEKKRILIDITGSTWCPPCIQLQKEVFSTKIFQDYAEKNLVLMKVDFADPVSEPKVGMDFVRRFVPGDLQLPTIAVASAEGKLLGVVPYDPNARSVGKQEEVGWLKKLFGRSGAKIAGSAAEDFIEKIEKVANK